MFLWSGIFQSKWILSQLNTCIRKKKKPLLSLPSGLEASCQMLFWKKPHSEVVLSLKNNVERRYNLGEQMKGGGESPVSLANIVHCWGAPGVLWRDKWESLDLPQSWGFGDCGPQYKENKQGHRYAKKKRCLAPFLSSQFLPVSWTSTFWQSRASRSPRHLGADCPN